MDPDAKYVETFCQEARELLGQVEDTLLDLEKKPDDKECVHRLFRAMHTIKGSGAMWGFDAIADIAHHAETLLACVRDETIIVSEEFVNAIFLVRDQIKAMLDTDQTDRDAHRIVCNDIAARLRCLTPDHAVEAADFSHKTDALSSQGDNAVFHIRFHPDGNMMKRGMDPAFFLNKLRDLGECDFKAHIDNVPLLDELEVETVYFFWDIVLSTSAGLNAVKDEFIFWEDESNITIQEIKHGTEDAAIYPRPGADIDAESVRVSSHKIDRLINLVGEMVVTQAHISHLAEGREHSVFAAPVKKMERLAGDLRKFALDMRMLPVEVLFRGFRRLVRDLSSDLGKDVEFTVEGGQTELDKTILERLHDPLVHLIRNSVDHGIQSPDEREKMGKPRKGAIRVAAAHCGARIQIQVSDDGAGIDSDAIRKKAIDNGLISNDEILSETEIHELMFMPGFSTAGKVTDVSGRGVGLDVVKQEISALGGAIEIDSTPGQGTTFNLSLPLTLAIIEGLHIRVEDMDFVIPVSQVETCGEMKCLPCTKSNRQQTIRLKDDLIPFIRLGDFFGIKDSVNPVAHIAVVQTGHYRLGVVVDEILGNTQAVVKPLDPLYRQAEGVSGATIMGNGTVALIVDLMELIRCVKHRFFSLTH